MTPAAGKPPVSSVEEPTNVVSVDLSANAVLSAVRQNKRFASGAVVVGGVRVFREEHALVSVTLLTLRMNARWQ